MHRFVGRAGFLAAVALGAMTFGIPAQAQERARQEYNLEAQNLSEALLAVSRQSGKEIMFSDEAVAGKRAPRLRGAYSPEEAVRALIAGTDLMVDFSTDGILVRGRSEAPGEIGDRSAVGGDILVTGSRIGGSVATSPIIVLSQQEMKKAGFTNLGDVVRSIPQNFAGGQNPTVAGGGIQGATNQNVTSSSTFNLRGLGPDATLTLLNGHRMPYDGIFQGVDISSIPLSAVDRIEVVTDGASAIYGSDAVAGVANVLLKKSFSGLETTAQFGGSTNGGNQQVRAGLVAGSDWNSGGFMGAFDYSRQTEILAGDRDYAQTMQSEQTLVPRLRQYSAILTGYQRIGSGVRFEFDSTYNRRKSRIQTPTSSAANYLKAGALSAYDVETFSVSPSLHIDLAPTWQAYLMGSYAESNASILSQIFANGSVSIGVPVDYSNRLKTAEAGFTGRLVPLPGGALKLAIGGGYRSNVLDALARQLIGGTQRVTLDFTKGRDSWYAFGELNAPIASPENDVPFVRRLVVSGAVRYEKYPDVGEIVTPKAGLLYSPAEPLDLKISWGRSFKSPTLYQQFQSKSTVLRAASAYGASAFPVGSTVIGLSGGNDALQPERAETFTGSVTFRPQFAPGANIEVSYFNVRYRDRIVVPIPSNLGLFANPAYAPFVTLTPSMAEITAALANAPAGLTNAAGAPYNPANVVAIVDNRQQNSSRQNIEGVDISARYGFAAGGSHIDILADASYLSLKQVFVAGQSPVDLSGTIYNPPHWRFRGGVQFQRGGLSASSYLNFSSSNRDQRVAPAVDVAAFTTLDAAITYRIEGSESVADGLEFTLAAANLLDADPGRIRQSSTVEPTYDSSNASPVGRFVSLTVRKQW